MPEANDMELLREFAKTGSETVFAELVQRHINLVYSVALRHVGISAHAEEITQAVFIILAHKAASLRPNTVLEGWLHSTTRLTALSFLRSERRRQFREQEAYMQSTIQQSANVASDVVWEQMAPLLDEAVSQLAQKDRDVLVLRFFKGQNIREVASGLGASEAAAQRRVLRALDKLRKFFAKRGISSTTAIIAGTLSANSVHAAPAALAKPISAAALVKGATASVSTVTIIKGALKIMAWTKVKTAVVIGLAIIAATGTTTIIVKETFFPVISDSYFEPNYRHFQNLPRNLFVLRATHFTEPVDGLDYSAETSSPSGEHVTLFMGRNRSFEQLINKAYGGTPAYTIFPANLPQGNFDYLCTILDSRAGEHLQTAIKKKFGYIAKWQQRNLQVCLLKIKRPNSPALKAPNPLGNSATWRNSGEQLQVRNQSLASLGYEIQNAANVPVLDQTGLPDALDFDFDCPISALAGRDWESVNTALDSLGLELIPTNMPMNMLVVEKTR